MKPLRIPFTNYYIGRGNPYQKSNQSSKPDEATVHEKLLKDRTRRVQEDVGKWRDALSSAEDPYYPDRRKLNRLYRDMVLDPHLSSVMQTRKLNIMGKRFRIVDEDGEEDEEATRIVQGQWSLTLQEIIMDTRFHGPTVAEFMEPEGMMPQGVKSIPRDYVLPERMEVRYDMNQLTGERIDKEPMDLWVFMVGDPKDFGLLNNVAHPTLIKRASISAWAEYNEVYGVPMVVGKTRSKAGKKRTQFENMLANFPENRWILTDLDQDELQIIEPSVGTQATFKDLIQQTNDEISKLIVGQTMTTEDGSSLAQGEVHERVMQGYEEADMRYAKGIWDNQVIPRLQRMGLLGEGLFFDWDTKEELSIKEKFEFDKLILQTPGYRLDPEYLEQQYGSPVEEEQSSQSSTPGSFANDADLLNLANASFSEFPEEAIANAQKALEFIRNNRGRGSNDAKRIARKIVRKEPIGKVGLRKISTYAKFESSADKPFEESDASLNYHLVGGYPMVRQFVPESLKTAEVEEKVANRVIQVVNNGGGNKGG